MFIKFKLEFLFWNLEEQIELQRNSKEPPGSENHIEKPGTALS